MKLKEMPTSELIKILNERKKLYNSYKTDFESKVGFQVDQVDTKEEVVIDDFLENCEIDLKDEPKQIDEILLDYKDVVFVEKKKNDSTENNTSLAKEIESNNKIFENIELERECKKKIAAGAQGVTKTYNERMKRGFFKRKRIR